MESRELVSAQICIESYTTPNLPPHLEEEISDFNASAWDGPPFDHFAFHEDDPDSSLSLAAYFEQVGQECPPSVDRSGFNSKEQRAKLAANLESNYHLRVDPEECRRVHSSRFADTGYVTIARDIQTSQIRGVLHARVASIRRLIDTTEWLRPRLFCASYGADDVNKPLSNDSESYVEFLSKLAYHFDLSENHMVSTIDTEVVAPQVRHTGVFRQMLRAMAEAFKPEHAHLPLISSMSKEGSFARTLNEALACRTVYGVLPSNECLAFSERTFYTMAYALASRAHFEHAVTEQIRKEKATHYSSGWDHANVSVKVTGDGRGLGVFATRSGVKKGETVARFVGESYRNASASALHPSMVDHAVQTSRCEYRFGRHGLAQLINHSCRPNLALHDGVELRSLIDIPAGAELTWCYSTSEDNDWSIPCKCGNLENCLGRVLPFSELPDCEQRRLLEAGLVSEWIADKLRQP